jgi:hypothetical protein
MRPCLENFAGTVMIGLLLRMAGLGRSGRVSAGQVAWAAAPSRDRLVRRSGADTRKVGHGASVSARAVHGCGLLDRAERSGDGSSA